MRRQSDFGTRVVPWVLVAWLTGACLGCTGMGSEPGMTGGAQPKPTGPQAPLAANQSVPPSTSPGASQPATSSGIGTGAGGANAALAMPPSAPPPAPVTVGNGITYHKDIRPLMEANCMVCHGGEAPIGPPFDSWEHVSVLKETIEDKVRTGAMPPWPAVVDGDCPEIAEPLALPPDKKALFTAWKDGGFAEGNPTDYVAPQKAGRSALDLKDASYMLSVAKAYTPSVDDEYTCFALTDGKSGSAFAFPDTTYLKGIQVIPGAGAEVHHVQVHRTGGGGPIGPTNCSGAVPGSIENMFSWRPGSTPLAYPAGSASEMPKGGSLVVQIHYNAIFSKAGKVPDTTRVALWTYSGEDKPQSLVTRRPLFANFNIPAGQKDVMSQVGTLAPGNGEIIGVSPHAHMRATVMHSAFSAGGKQRCLVNVPKWDYHWQFDYLFTQPIPVKAGDMVSAYCKWDNSAANQPYVNDMQLQPMNVTFGEGSLQEMCLHYIWFKTPMR